MVVEVLERRQVLRPLQPEVLQEALRGHEQRRPAGAGRSAALVEQPAGPQRRDRRIGVHAAHGLDGGAGDRLPVRDDGQRLQRGAGEPALRLQPEEVLHVGRGLGSGDELRAFRPPLQPHATLGQRLGERLQRTLQRAPRHLQGAGKRTLLHRPVGDEEQRLDQRGQRLRGRLGRFLRAGLSRHGCDDVAWL